MPLPRSQQISLEQTPVYHVISRCVRRQYLCGEDSSTGKDFSHRRDALRARLAELVEIFAIDVCAYKASWPRCQAWRARNSGFGLFPSLAFNFLPTENQII